MENQITLEEVSEEYKAFVDKFKPKKTTDDCYTPENIYEAVKEWVCKEYGINPDDIVRPFWPGGDYERFPYTEDSVVVDNPPFSIISKICTFYNNNGIRFFLFAPYLTNFTSGRDTRTQHIITGTGIVYENGADIGTSFLTNMDEWFLRSVPELADRIEEENKSNLAQQRKTVPKYVYPDEVITSSDLGYMSKHGVSFNVSAKDCYFIRGLEAQKPFGKAIFGSGFLLSEKAAAEKAAAEKAAAEKAAATKWQLSDREKEIVKSLGK